MSRWLIVSIALCALGTLLSRAIFDALTDGENKGDVLAFVLIVVLWPFIVAAGAFYSLCVRVWWRIR